MKMKMKFGLFLACLALLACDKDDVANDLPEVMSIDLQDAVCLFDKKTELGHGTLCKLTKDGEVLPVNFTLNDNTTITAKVSGLKHFTDKYLYIMTSMPDRIILYEKATGIVHNLTNMEHAMASFPSFNRDREVQPVHTDREGNMYFNLSALHRLDANLEKITPCVSNDYAKDVDVNLDGVVYRKLHGVDDRRTFTLPSGTVLRIDGSKLQGGLRDIFLGVDNEHFYVLTRIDQGSYDNGRTFRLVFSEQGITFIPCSHFAFFSGHSDNRANVFKNDKRQTLCGGASELIEKNCEKKYTGVSITNVAKDFFVYKGDNSTDFFRIRKTDYKQEVLNIFDEKTVKNITVSCSPTSNNIGFYGSPSGDYVSYIVGYIDENNQQVRGSAGYLSPDFFVLLK